MRNVLGMALVALALAGCADDENTGINNGRMMVNLTETVEREMHMRFVLTVAVPEELEDALPVSLNYWEDEFDMALFVPAEEGEEPDINVELGDVGGWGRAFPDSPASYPDWTPIVTGGRIIIDSAILASETCTSTILTHELGHLLALADDHSTGYIMDTNIWCELVPMLPSDHELVEEDIEAM